MTNNPKDNSSSQAQFDQLSRAEERMSLSEKIKFLEGQISANKNKIAELTEVSQALSNANRDLTCNTEEIAHANKTLDLAKEKLANASTQLATLAEEKDPSKK